MDAGLIARSAKPTLAGISRHDVSDAPTVMFRTRKKTIVLRAPSQVPYMQALARDEVIFALGPAGTGKTYLAVAHGLRQRRGPNAKSSLHKAQLDPDAWLQAQGDNMRSEEQTYETQYIMCYW